LENAHLPLRATLATPEDNKGQVFQAEEVLVNGKWERYFGFATSKHLAKVPAVEMEFPGPGYPQIDHGFEAYLNPFGKADRDHPYPLKLDPNDPAAISLRIRNRLGIDQTLPGSILLAPDAKKSLPTAVKLSLDYSPDIATNDQAVRNLKWQPLPLRDGIIIAPPQPQGTPLAPTQEQILLTGDLRDYFDLSRPGTYRLKAVFNDPANGLTGEAPAIPFIVPGS